MAKKYKQKINEYKHRDCIHAYGHHDIGANGTPILCKCPFEKHYILLSDPACYTHFKKIQ